MQASRAIGNVQNYSRCWHVDVAARRRQWTSLVMYVVLSVIVHYFIIRYITYCYHKSFVRRTPRHPSPYPAPLFTKLTWSYQNKCDKFVILKILQYILYFRNATLIEKITYCI